MMIATDEKPKRSTMYIDELIPETIVRLETRNAVIPA